MKDKIYAILFDRGLTISERQYSEKYCRRSHNYLAVNGKTGDAAAINVARKLLRDKKYITFAYVMKEIILNEDGNK